MAQQVTSTQPSQYIQDLLTREGSGLFPQLSDALDAPYQRYDGPRVAGFSQDQLDAFEKVRGSVGATDPQEQAASGLLSDALAALQQGEGRTQDLIDESVSSGSSWITKALENAESIAGEGNPLLGEATDLIRSSTQGPTEAGLQQYMDPFQSQVIDTTMAELNRQDAIAGQGRNAQAAQAGAFGGGRHGVVEAEAGRNLADVKARTLANLNSQNFGQALNTFQNQQQLQQSAGSNLAGMGAQDTGLRQSSSGQLLSGAGSLSDVFGRGASLQAGLTGQQAGGLGDLASKNLGLGSFIREQDMKDFSNLANIGQRQQAQEQAGLDTAYENFLDQRSYEDPRAKVAFMSDIIRGAPSGSQSMSQTYQDPMSPLQAIAGLAPLAAAFL